jgi:hypothetical protein
MIEFLSAMLGVFIFTTGLLLGYVVGKGWA